MSISTYTLFLLVFEWYLDGDDKSDRNVLVIKSMQRNIFHTYAFLDFIT
jgi:hypothetical protein